MVGQALGPEMGGILGGAGNIAAQGLRYAASGKPYDPTETAAATAWNMIPVAGQAARAGQIVQRNFPRVAGDVATEAARMASIGGTIKTGETLTKEGRLPTSSELGISAGGAGVLGFLGGATSEYGQVAVEKARQAMQFLGMYRRAGVQNPTLGQVMPQEWAALETRYAAEQPQGSAAKAVQKSYNELSDGLHQISGAGDVEPATVFESLSKQINTRALEPELLSLNQKSQQLQGGVSDALANVKSMQAQGDSNIIEAYNNLTNQALQASLDSSLENAQRILIQKIAPNGQQLLPTQARDALVGEVVKPMQAAYNRHFENLYSFFPDKIQLFGTGAILDDVNKVFKSHGKQIPGDIVSLLNPEEGKASLYALRQVRDRLFDLGHVSGGGATAVERAYTDLGRRIGQGMTDQAESAFGKELGGQFKLVNEDYRNYKELWDNPGVDALMAKDVNDDAVTKIVNSIKRSGIDSAEFKNVANLIGNLASPQSARNAFLTDSGVTLENASAKINPELAAALKGHFNDLVRGNIIDSVSNGNKVDAVELVKTLKEMGRGTGNDTLRTLGLGDLKQVEELGMLLNSKKDANALTGDQWRELFNSPSFKQSFQTGGTIASLIKPVLTQSDMQNKVLQTVLLENAGKMKPAQQKYNQLLAEYSGNSQELNQVQSMLDQARQNPTYAVFKKDAGERLNTQSWTALRDSLFNPSASQPVNHEYIREITDALRNSKSIGDRQLLQQIQNEFITTHLVQFKQGGPAYERVNVDSLSSLLSPNSQKSAKGELERAKAILDPEQFESLKGFADASKALSVYEKTAKAGTPKDDIKGTVLKGYNAIADMWNRGKYDNVTQALLNPKDYLDRIAIAGDWINKAGEATERVAMPLTRYIDRNRNAQPQQVQQPQPIPPQGPASLGQFLGRR
jgi:hypothetical protein